ncbi:MAG TPA: superoxide dismutase family protein [Thermoanaerobaculia bacterium]|nr:superoxide dismutase family protein [Thermoanaerobaculia bacterium]
MKKMVLPLLALVLVFGAACAIRTPPLTATAPLDAKSGSNVSGMVRFTETMADGVPAVLVSIDARNVPEGVHGFHVHEFGDCSAPDASSAGGHFNPTRKAHGAPNENPSHAGDFGNVLADSNGRVDATYLMREVTLGSGSHSIVGKAIVLHSDPDDLTTQPTGNAGGRIACGVIHLDGGM